MTFSALFLARGQAQDWNNVVVIVSENHCADLYSHLVDYNVVNIGPRSHREVRKSYR